MKPIYKTTKKGFTLVELLVVVTIILALSTLAFVATKNAMKKAKMTGCINNMRQIGILMGNGMSDRNNGLTPGRLLEEKVGGGAAQIYWHQALLLQQYPDNEEEILTDKQWWIDTKPVTKNPLFVKKTGIPGGSEFDITSPGFAMNSNLWLLPPPQDGTWAGMDPADPLASRPLPMSLIPDPARCPMIVPHFKWNTDEFLTGTSLNYPEANAQFLVNGQLNVLFVDGHSELIKFTDAKNNAMPMSEYCKRELHLEPKQPD